MKLLLRVEQLNHPFLSLCFREKLFVDERKDAICWWPALVCSRSTSPANKTPKESTGPKKKHQTSQMVPQTKPQKSQLVPKKIPNKSTGLTNETPNNKQGFWLVFISNNDILYIVATNYQESLWRGQNWHCRLTVTMVKPVVSVWIQLTPRVKNNDRGVTK